MRIHVVTLFDKLLTSLFTVPAFFLRYERLKKSMKENGHSGVDTLVLLCASQLHCDASMYHKDDSNLRQFLFIFALITCFSQLHVLIISLSCSLALNIED